MKTAAKIYLFFLVLFHGNNLTSGAGIVDWTSPVVWFNWSANFVGVVALSCYAWQVSLLNAVAWRIALLFALAVLGYQTYSGPGVFGFFPSKWHHLVARWRPSYLPAFGRAVGVGHVLLGVGSRGPGDLPMTANGTERPLADYGKLPVELNSWTRQHGDDQPFRR